MIKSEHYLEFLLIKVEKLKTRNKLVEVDNAYRGLIKVQNPGANFSLFLYLVSLLYKQETLEVENCMGIKGLAYNYVICVTKVSGYWSMQGYTWNYH